MAGIVVVADSSSNIPLALAEGLPLVIVPMVVVLEGRELRDGIDVTPDQFYAWQAAHPDAEYSTSCPSPGDFRAAYEDVAATADGIVSVHIAAGLSTTLDCASRGAALFAEHSPAGFPPVMLVDTGVVSMACGFCALAAARKAQEGAGLEQVLGEANRVRELVRMYAVLRTLRYAARSGRVPSIVKYVVAQIPVRPLLRIGGGRVSLVRADQSYQRAMRRLREVVVREAGGLPVRMAVMHAAAPEEAEELAAELCRACDCREIVIGPFTPVVGAHTGPGLLVVAFHLDKGE